ncbi:agmatinase family protein [Aquicella lusitana]|uniref:Agmatinase n=1 Tax=Aquicella lusitana TaxID=254246 RepID=A0A370GDM6_9COXI|nr:agmatinase family protein [Aquicella lusitana]RDI41330.1 agmatinase [Aquicella lusitana]VVC72304.1 N(1)-aminopropylagmatine ureohydrolase [Aquicella lusitana]
MTIKHFDPNAAASQDSGIFGLPFSPEEANLVLLPVPWEATTSYGGGTSKGPQAILQASKQVDLFDIDLGRFYETGIAMLEESTEVRQWNTIARKHAETVIHAQGTGEETLLQPMIDQVNAYSLKLNEYVYTQTKRLLSQGKCVGIVGGDHSTPFGAIQALLEKHPQMGILHIDAHADLREAFEGFAYSHASIMHNVMTHTTLPRLVQVGIRDFCEEEFNFIRNHPDRIITFFDSALSEQKLNGHHWAMICDTIIEHLPQEVYISFDIDGLDPRFCPHTGTPVPGGLDFLEALFLIRKVVRSGRTLVGFDLNEVSPGMGTATDNVDPAAEWDANVGARLLYKLCGWTLTSRIG